MRRLLFVLLLVGGCVASTAPKVADTPPPAGPSVPVIVRDASLMKGFSTWLPDVFEVYGTDIIGIVGHGTTFRGEWVVLDERRIPTPVEWVVELARKSHPTSTIFVFVCNPGHFKLDAPGVLYGTDSLWAFPDWVFPLSQRSKTHPGHIGTVEGLTYNPFLEAK